MKPISTCNPIVSSYKRYVGKSLNNSYFILLKYKI